MFIRLALIISVLTSSVAAAQSDQLPNELLLRCTGKQTTFIRINAKIDADQSRFDDTLRLKDRTIGNIKYNFADGQDCQLSNGIIDCKLVRTTYVSIPNSTELRHSTVQIVRATGEYHYHLKTWSAPGKSKPVATNKPGLEIFRSGVCQPISRPLF